MPKKLRDAAERMLWVEQAAARLREQGRVLTGEVFVVPRPDTSDLVALLDPAGRSSPVWIGGSIACWVTPVSGLDDHAPPRS